MPKGKSKLKTRQKLLLFLWSAWKVLSPRERLWLLEIGYFIGVAGAAEPKQQCPAKKLFSALSLQAEGIQC